MDTFQSRIVELLGTDERRLAEYARAIGVTRQTIYNLRDGVTKADKVRAATVWGLSDLFGVRPEWLLFGVLPKERASQAVGLDPITMTEALKLLDYDEEIGGEYAPQARAQQLIALYDHVAANGGQPTLVFIGNLTKKAEKRQDAKTRGVSHERGAKR